MERTPNSNPSCCTCRLLYLSSGLMQHEGMVLDGLTTTTMALTMHAVLTCTEQDNSTNCWITVSFAVRCARDFPADLPIKSGYCLGCNQHYNCLCMGMQSPTQKVPASLGERHRWSHSSALLTHGFMFAQVITTITFNSMSTPWRTQTLKRHMMRLRGWNTTHWGWMLLYITAWSLERTIEQLCVASHLMCCSASEVQKLTMACVCCIVPYET